MACPQAPRELRDGGMFPVGKPDPPFIPSVGPRPVVDGWPWSTRQPWAGQGAGLGQEGVNAGKFAHSQQ